MQKIIEATRLLPGLAWAGLLQNPTRTPCPLHVCTSPTAECPCLHPEFPKLVSAGAHVRSSGFLETLNFPSETAPQVILLPLLEGGEIREILALGLQIRQPPGARCLNFYLGFAGIAGQALGHWNSARKLEKRRDELDRAVQQRTAAFEALNRQLSEQREFARTILEHLEVVVVVCEAEARLVFFNRQAREWPGLNPEGIPPEEWATMYSLFEADGETPLAMQHNPLWRAFRGETIREFPMCIRPPGQPGRIINASASPLLGPGGKFFEAVAILHDITANQAAEKQLRETNTRLEEALHRSEELARKAEAANVAKSQFLANMSHELRTPMNGVLGMAQLLQTTPLSSEQKEYLQTIQSSGEALLSLINDILDFSKIEAGQLDLESIVFQPRQVMQNVQEALLHVGAAEDLQISFQTTPEVPETLLGDPHRLQQIITNLVGNALKFTSEGCVCARLDVAAQSPEWVLLKFSVRDTGIGVPPEKQPLLFQKFSQLDASHTRRFGGTGLGLAISKQLADLLGGEIGVISPLPKPYPGSLGGPGAEFWFTARFSRAEEPVVGPASPSESPSKLQGHRVLVVEDNPVNQKMLLMLLKKIGLEARAANDGQEALEVLLREPYDLVFMDIQMPVLDGLETTRAIRTLPADNPLRAVPIVAVTVHAFPEDRQRCLSTGMNDYLVKPLSRPALERVLQAWLR